MSRISWTVIAIFAAGLCLLFAPFANGILWGAMLAFPAYPLYRKVQARHRVRVAFLAASALLVLVLALLALAARELTTVAEILIPWWKEEVSARWPVPPMLLHAPVAHQTLVRLWQDLVHAITHPMLEGPQKLDDLLHILKGAGGLVGTIFVACLLFFFFLKESTQIRVAYAKILSVLDPLAREGVEAFRETLLAIQYSILFGLPAEILALWLIYGLADVPHPLLFATFCSLIAVIPIAGSIVAITIGGFLILYHHAWFAAILSTFFALTVLGVADNLAKPALARVLSKNGRVPSVFWLVFGMLGGLLLIGLPGIFLGPSWTGGAVRIWQQWVAPRDTHIPPS